MRPNALIIAVFVLALAAPAFASGTVRIRQSDGSLKTYPGVTLKLDGGWSLALTSADKVSTLVLSDGSCTPAGDGVRCTGGKLSFHQDGRTRAVPFKTAWFSFNLMNNANSVSMAVTTAKGTHLTGSGKLDGVPAR